MAITLNCNAHPAAHVITIRLASIEFNLLGIFAAMHTILTCVTNYSTAPVRRE